MLESLFNKVAGLNSCNFIKKWLQHRCFPVKFAKFLRTPFFHRTPPVSAFDKSTIQRRIEDLTKHIRRSFLVKKRHHKCLIRSFKRVWTKNQYCRFIER